MTLSDFGTDEVGLCLCVSRKIYTFNFKYAMLIMHKQCVHLQAHRIVINHRVVLILPVQLFTDQPLDYHHQ
jgi:hypothetical protein